jgi:prolyl-tRNA editing enzyme YbaK/EbsC (Cys-tRNA(Pro) deacylase)
MNDSVKLEKLNSLLQSKNADYSISTHDFSIETASVGAEHYGISLDETTPTLILKTKERYLAAIICGNTRISFKKLKQALRVKDISMADPQTVLNITGAKSGRSKFNKYWINYFN